MQLKLDENLPTEIAETVASFGHDVDTVIDEGLAGCDDGAVWQAVTQAGRFFVTQDLDFSDIRFFTPGTHPGLLLVRLEHPSRSRLISRLHQVFETEDIESWQGCLVVASDHKIRVRRP